VHPVVLLPLFACVLAPDPPGVKTTSKVDKVGTHLRATLTIETARSKGERVLEAESCEALVRSAAVVVAMAATPQRVEEEEEPAEPAPPPPAPAPVAPAQSEHDSPAPARVEKTRFVARAESIADTAMLPSVVAGGGIALGLDALERLHVEAHASMFGTAEGRLDDGRGATFSLLSTGARGCWALTRGIEVAPCAGIEVMRLSATGFGAATTTKGDAVVVAPEGLLTLRVAISGPLAIRAGAGALAPISRQSFVITGRGSIHEVPVVSFRGFVGPEVLF